MKEIHHRYGVSVQRLKWMKDFMRKPGADHLQAAAQLMATLGVGGWLLTDLEETFIMDSELEMLYLTEGGFFGGDAPAGYFMLKIDPLVNRMLSTLKDPVELPAHGKTWTGLTTASPMSRIPWPRNFLLLVRLGE